MSDYAAARFHMVECQIRPNKVTDHRLVDALMDVPRELFVPQPLRGVAYVDGDVAVGKGRYLMEPMVFARMLQEAGVDETANVLDIGCATGYSTAVLGRMAASVVGVESDPALASAAKSALLQAGVANAEVVNGPLGEGCAAKAPYDVIIFEGAVAEVPQAICDQLAEGGRMVATVLGDRGLGEVRLYQRYGRAVSSRVLFEAQPHLLPGLEPKPKFEF
ncbi:protein-L-isoaspartate O-methyltransferase family protein [Azospirillum sp. sgz301742]